MTPGVWILIALIGAQPLWQDFNSREACEEAARTVRQMVEAQAVLDKTAVQTRCVFKGLKDWSHHGSD